MRRLSLVFAAVLAAFVFSEEASAQGVCFGSNCGSASGSGVPTNIPSGTPTDCTALSVWRTSAGQLLECGLGLTYSNGVIAAGTASTLRGGLDLFGATHAFSTRFQVSESQGAGITYTLPTTDGAASEFLQTNGSGALTWAAVSSTITSGTTATSGCVAGGVLRSISNLVECGAGLTYASNVLKLDGGSANSGVEVFYTNSNIAGIRAGSGQAYLRLGFGTAGLVLQRQDGGVFYGAWNGTGLRAGDATTPTAAFEVTNLAAAKGIMTLYDNVTPVLTVADGGATTFASTIYAPDAGYSFTGNTGTGITHVTAENRMKFRLNTNFWAAISTAGFEVPDEGIAFASQGTLNGAITLDTKFKRVSSGVVKVGTSATTTGGFVGGGTAVASATALPLPTGRVFHVTGTTTITSITSTNFVNGVVITLIFDDVLTFTDGSNLKLAGDFVTTADDTITLTYDGTNWYETSRSVN